ncbi:MAG: lysoplasmalogenase [Hyphomicrobiales bacterium]|nr:lysoplasmalogenase [Hyphomicrobiales bacterium]
MNACAACRPHAALARVNLAALVVGALAFRAYGPALAAPFALVAFLAFAVAGAAVVCWVGRISVLELAFAQMAGVACIAHGSGPFALFAFAKVSATALCAAAFAQRAHGGRQKTWVLAALIFSLAGDAWLLDKAYFAAGLGCFLIAHICYIGALAVDGGARPSTPALAVFALCAGLVAYRIWPNLATPMKAPVVVYMATLATMSAVAFARARKLGGAAWLVWLGSLSFVLSDSALALDRFAGRSVWLMAAVLPLYYLAQALLTFFIATGDQRIVSRNQSAMDSIASSSVKPS